MTIRLKISPQNRINLIVRQGPPGPAGAQGTPGTANITDGDKGDITTSGSGEFWQINAGAVTYAKIQNVSATARILGRKTTGAGVVEELTGAEAAAIVGGTVIVSETAPLSPANGMIWLDPTIPVMLVRYNNSWAEI